MAPLREVVWVDHLTANILGRYEIPWHTALLECGHSKHLPRNRGNQVPGRMRCTLCELDV